VVSPRWTEFINQPALLPLRTLRATLSYFNVFVFCS